VITLGHLLCYNNWWSVRLLLCLSHVLWHGRVESLTFSSSHGCYWFHNLLLTSSSSRNSDSNRTDCCAQQLTSLTNWKTWRKVSENSATKKHIQCTFIEKEHLGFLWFEIILYKQRLIELFGSCVVTIHHKEADYTPIGVVYFGKGKSLPNCHNCKRLVNISSWTAQSITTYKRRPKHDPHKNNKISVKSATLVCVYEIIEDRPIHLLVRLGLANNQAILRIMTIQLQMFSANKIFQDAARFNKEDLTHKLSLASASRL
ncbi:hypothetical protein PROFUN_15433, partial [Planoprotostelium fungivorum]